MLHCKLGNRDRSVGIATDCGLDGRGSIPQRGNKFSLLHSVQTGTEAHPVPFPEVKLSRREAYSSPPSSAEFKNGGAVTPLPHTFSWRGD
jgi:hypothetical protein